MHQPSPFFPESVFQNALGPLPQVLAAPSRYIQGAGVLDQLGGYLSLVPARRVVLYLTAGGERRDGARIKRSLDAAGIDSRVVIFGGECSFEEIERGMAAIRGLPMAADCVVAVGGGKCIDAGKGIAFRLGLPMVSCPSLASNDAPCSALSVIYTPEGVTELLEFYPQNPVLVVVDTQVVAEAPVRYLVSGMGDALATWYEARTCLQNPAGRSMLGARPTLAAAALGELCANTLFADGVAAANAVYERQVTPALEHVIEANTLLSGIGFESGGLAGAHAVAQGLTVLPQLHPTYMHGEMVAIGLITQLVLESRMDEAKRVAEFCASVGLPAHYGHLSLTTANRTDMMAAMTGATAMAFLQNEPFPVTADMLLAAAVGADELGRAVVARVGDEAYRRLHGVR
jgi:glycerol dehydrogenase